jgi:hypothetical protein
LLCPTFVTLLCGKTIAVAVRHFAVKRAGEPPRVIFPGKLQAKADLAARKENDLKQGWFETGLVEPSSHLGHGGAEIATRPPKLNNVLHGEIRRL